MNKLKLKKGSVVIYVLAIMLVTAGYWSYISKEANTIQTVSMNQNETDGQNTNDENLGDATLVSNNELIQEEKEQNGENEKEEQTQTEEKDGYFEESKLSRDTMYSQTLESYQGILNNSNVSEEQKAIVTEEI